MHYSVVTIKGIDEALANLRYRSVKSPKYRLVRLIRSYYGEDGLNVDRISSQELIRSLWEIPEENNDEVSRKIRNFNSLKSAINKDLIRLYAQGKNPEGVIIGPDNTFVMSEEAKDDVLSEFTKHIKVRGGVGLDQIAEVLEIVSEIVSGKGGLLDSESSQKEKIVDSLKGAIESISRDLGLGLIPSGQNGPEAVASGEDEGEDSTGFSQESGGEAGAETEYVGIIDDEDELVDEVEDIEDEVDECEVVAESEAVEGQDESSILSPTEQEVVEEEAGFGQGDSDGQDAPMDDADGFSEETEEQGDRGPGREYKLGDDQRGDGVEEAFDKSIDGLELVGVADEDIEESEELEKIVDEDEMEPETSFEVQDSAGPGEEFVEGGADLFDGDNLVEGEDVEILTDDAMLEAEDVDEPYDDPVSEGLEVGGTENIPSAPEDLSEVEQEESEYEEGPLPLGLGEGLGQDDLENLDPKVRARLLAEAFDGYLGAMDRYYNQYLLIPGGEYLVGSKDKKDGRFPERIVGIEPFYIGQFPVTNGLFAIFVEKTGYITTAERYGYGIVFEGRLQRIVDPLTSKKTIISRSGVTMREVKGACWYRPRGPGSDLHGKRNHPVVQVSLEDAMAFAAWTGKRLPTEAEWEAAARSRRGFIYPWGNEWKENCCNIETSYIGDTSPVDKFKDFTNELGITDTLGNVMEWTTTQVDERPGSGNRARYIVKGGGWLAKKGTPLWHRVLFERNYCSNVLGFRCVAY